MRKQAGKSLQLKEEKTLAVLIPLTLLPKNQNLFLNIKKDETEGWKKRNVHVLSLTVHFFLA
jgi:hypothetical protein